MQHVRFGRTGLQVSRLCLGTMTFGLQCDEPTSFAILDAAAEAGITFLDTADVYPLGGTVETAGRTEEIVGKWLRGRRDRFIVATKCSGKMGPAPWQQGTSRKHVLEAIDASLKRLGTDYVDLYQVHHHDAATPTDETLEAFDAVVRSGKARYIGCSNYHAYRVARALGRSEALGPRQVRLGAAALQPAVPADRARAAAALRGRGPRRHALQSARRRAAHRQAQALCPASRGDPLHPGRGGRHVHRALLEGPRVRRRGRTGRARAARTASSW